MGGLRVGVGSWSPSGGLGHAGPSGRGSPGPLDERVSENYCRSPFGVPLKGYDKGAIRVPFKGSIRVYSLRKLGAPEFLSLGSIINRILLFRVLY